ncbi:trypsin delta-like [Drosophila biarmipes]|uniref:trypsin delta-like n=1 Tax=Drosophila biarmipes TaxID=125945 RepID=UPI0007E63D01|nr:trypsin delta-like [Drosophila biarmipes]
MLTQWIFLVFGFFLVSAESITERIFGGNSVRISDIPWQASLHRNGKHTCDAVIYSDNIVISAAHCIPTNNNTKITVRVGSTLSDSGGQEVIVSRSKIHERFGHSLSNDIAVIRLQSSLQMGVNVRSIPLANSSPRPESTASVSGWGPVGCHQEEANSLLETNVVIVDLDSCQRSYGQGVPKDVICAAASEKGFCSGGSGGPLVLDGQLVGIVSFGKGCAHPEYPGIYIDVAQQKSWILKAIRKVLCPCSKVI